MSRTECRTEEAVQTNELLRREMLKIYVGDVFLYREVGWVWSMRWKRIFCFYILFALYSWFHSFLSLFPCFFYNCLSGCFFSFTVLYQRRRRRYCGLVWSQTSTSPSTRSVKEWQHFINGFRYYLIKTYRSFVFIIVWIEGANFKFIFVESSSMFWGYVQGQQQVRLFVWCRCFEIGFKAPFNQTQQFLDASVGLSVSVGPQQGWATSVYFLSAWGRLNIVVTLC